MSAPLGIRDRIETAVHRFRGEWGNLEHTVDVQVWDDGDVQVEVYHSTGRHTYADVEAVRRLSTLVDVDGSVEHREYTWRPDQIMEVLDRR